MLALALSVVSSSFAGAVLADRIHPGLSKIEKAGLGFLLAFGTQAWILQILHAIGVPPGATAHVAISILAGTAALAPYLRRAYRSSQYRLRLASDIRRISSTLPPARIGILVTLAAISSAGAMCSPVLQWDAQGIWVGKALGFIVADSLSGIVVGEHLHYPIGLPILMAGALDLGGEPGVKVIGPLFAAALAAVVLGSIDRRGTGWVGTLTSAAIVVAPFALSYTFVAYAELPMTAVYVVSSIYLIEYVRSSNRGALWLSALLLGVTSLIRLEAPFLFAVNFAVLLFYGRVGRARNAVTYLAVFALAWGPWQIISRVVLGVDSGFTGLVLAPFEDIVRGEFDWPRVGAIAKYFLERAVFWEWWGLTFPLAASGLIVLFFRDRQAGILLASLIAGNLLVQLYEYYSSVYLDVEIFGDKLHYFLESGFDRMTLHWAPLGIYGAGLAISTLRDRAGAAASTASMRPA
ncbi:MAG: hypothetical protein QF609_00635 [Gammaproteobacteria bacterium]|nr:hypothetical protein [Gammaproteobacteria bacterium]